MILGEVEVHVGLSGREPDLACENVLDGERIFSLKHKRAI